MLVQVGKLKIKKYIKVILFIKVLEEIQASFRLLGIKIETLARI